MENKPNEDTKDDTVATPHSPSELKAHADRLDGDLNVVPIVSSDTNANTDSNVELGNEVGYDSLTDYNGEQNVTVLFPDGGTSVGTLDIVQGNEEEDEENFTAYIRRADLPDILIPTNAQVFDNEDEEKLTIRIPA